MIHQFNNVRIQSIMGAAGAEQIDVLKMCSAHLEEKKAQRLIKTLGFAQLRQLSFPYTTADLCCRAAKEMLMRQQVGSDSIDAFIMVTQTPDSIVPATTFVRQTELGLNHEILMLDLVQGCAGFVYGLFYASSLISSGVCRKVLVCAGDTSCVARNISKIDQAGNAAMFGDGGSAALVVYDENAASSTYSIQSHGEYAAVISSDFASWKRLRSADRTADGEPPKPSKGSHIDGVQLASYAMNDVKNDILRLLAHEKMSFNDVSYAIVHQANQTIVKTLAATLNAGINKVPFLAGRTGNTSSASIPLALSENIDNLLLIKDKPTLLCGFGVGMCIASAIIDLSCTNIYPAFYL